MGKRSNTSVNGFTIVELLIVIVVIGILAAITLVAYNGVQNRAAEAVLEADLNGAVKQISMSEVENPSFASTIASNGGTLNKSAGTSYQYSYISGSRYCITATSDRVSVKSIYYTSDAGTIEEGQCAGHTSGDVAITCPVNFIVIPGSSTFGTSDFCVMKYEARQTASTTVPVSQATGTPWQLITQANATTYSQSVADCVGCHIISENEWLTIAQNVIGVAGNWSGGAVGSGYVFSGHNDGTPASPIAASINDADGYYLTGNSSGSQRRTLTLSNGEVIWDFAGNAWEMTFGKLTGNQPGASGWAYRQWKDVTSAESLSLNTYPSYAAAVASGWTSTHGIGQLYSSTSNNGIIRAFVRGGGWGDTSGAGIYALNLSVAAASSSGNSISFRVAK